MSAVTPMRIALAQINPTVGDVDGNAAKIAEWIERARDAGAELVIFPELCIPGYPAEDLYLKRHFLAANGAAVEELARGRRAGSPRWSASPSRSPAAATTATPTTRSPSSPTAPSRRVYRKNRLPNYAVFDEQRYFVPGTEPRRDRGRRHSRSG